MPHSFLYDIVFEVVIHSLDHVGASVRWFFTKGDVSYKEVYVKKYNTLLGFLMLAAFTAIVIYLSI